MNRIPIVSKRRIYLLIAVVAGATATSLPAVAELHPSDYGWVHGIGPQVYYMPGGPQEHWMSACIVQTVLQKYSESDSAGLLIHNDGRSTICAIYGDDNWIQAVLWDGSHYVDGPLVQTNRDSVDTCGSTMCNGTESRGRKGLAIFGAHVQVWNTNGLRRTWDITAL